MKYKIGQKVRDAKDRIFILVVSHTILAIGMDGLRHIYGFMKRKAHLLDSAERFVQHLWSVWHDFKITLASIKKQSYISPIKLFRLYPTWYYT